MKLNAMIVFAAVFAPVSVASAEVQNWAMPVSATYGYGTDAGATMQTELRAEPEFELTTSEKIRWKFSGRLRLDPSDKLLPGKPNRDSYASASRPLAMGSVGIFELRDAFLQAETNNGIVRLGKQQVVWGRLDGLKVLDILNPQSFREFILDDFGDSRISTWSAYVDQSISGWRAEIVLIPEATGHDVPADDAWFQLTSPRFRYGANPEDITPPTATRRSAGLSAGLRLSRQLGSVDIGGVAYSGIDFEPLGSIAASGNEVLLTRFYKRRKLFGLSAETAFGSAAVRAEFALQPDRTFNTRDGTTLDVIQLDQAQMALAIDLNGPFDTFVNFQYLLDHIRNAPAILVRPQRDRIVTAFVRRTFGYDSAELTVRWYRSLEDRSDLFSASAAYQLGDSTTLRFAAETFRGQEIGLFGQFADRDRITVGIEHTF